MLFVAFFIGNCTYKKYFTRLTTKGHVALPVITVMLWVCLVSKSEEKRERIREEIVASGRKG